MYETRSRSYLALAAALSVLLIGHWRLSATGLYDSASVPLVVKLGLTAVAFVLAFRGSWLRNEGGFVVAAVGLVVIGGVALRLALLAPAAFLGPSRIDAVLAAMVLGPLTFALVSIRGSFDPLGRFVGGPR